MTNLTLMNEDKWMERVHANALLVLQTLGIRISDRNVRTMVIEHMGRMGGFDLSEIIPMTRDALQLSPEYVKFCFSLAGKKIPYDPGKNSLFVGGHPTHIDLTSSTSAVDRIVRESTYADFENAMKLICKYPNIIKGVYAPICGQRDQAVLVSIMQKMLPPNMRRGIAADRMSEYETYQTIAPNLSHTFCALGSPLVMFKDLTRAMVRSAGLGATVGICPMPQGACTGPNSPEGLLTLCWAELLAMNCIVQAARTGTTVIWHPFVIPTSNYKEMTGTAQHALIACAIAHLCTKHGVPSSISVGGCHEKMLNEMAVDQGKLTRSVLLTYGFHMCGHAFGQEDNLMLFNPYKLEIDAKNARDEIDKYGASEYKQITIPRDDLIIETIARVGINGTYKGDEHLLKWNEQFWQWDEGLEIENLWENEIPKIY